MTGAPPSGPADPGLVPADEPSGPWAAVASPPLDPDDALPGPAPAEPGAPPADRSRRRPRPPRGPSRWRTAFIGLAVLAAVGAVGWAVGGSKLLVVRSEQVAGTHLLAPAQVTAAADVPLGTPLARVDTGAVIRRVEAIRQVASATVTRGWPDGLLITVTERVPVMAVKMAAGGYDQVDKTGVVVRYSTAKPALPLLTTTLTGTQLDGSSVAGAAAAVLGELQPSLARQVGGVKPTSVTSGPEQVTLTLRDGTTVIWGDTSNAAQKNRELAIVLPHGARHIDVSAPGTVVTHLFAAVPPVKSA